MMVDTRTKQKVSEDLFAHTRHGRGSTVGYLLRELRSLGVPEAGDNAVADELGYQLYLNLRQLYETQRLDELKRTTEQNLVYGRAMGRF
jgi:hypothetical protein